MKRLLVLLPVVFSALASPQKSSAQDANAAPRTLEAQIKALEERLSELEKRLDSIADPARPSRSFPPADSTLKERLEALARKVQELESSNSRRETEEKRAIKQSPPAEVASQLRRAKDDVNVGAGREGFFLRSADGDFQLKLRGYFQVDSRWFFGDRNQTLADTFIIRRARPIIEGTVYKYFDFRIMPDFGGGQTTLQDLHLDARFWPQARFRFGKAKAPFGLERLQSATDTTFIERALPTALVPNRDLGLQIFGDVGDGAISYAAGIFNGSVDGGSNDSDTGDGKDLIARLFAHPFKRSRERTLQGLGLGLAGSAGNERGNAASPNLPSYRTTGQQLFFRYRSDGTAQGTTIADGRRYRLSPQAYYYAGPVGVLAEYVWTSQRVRRGAAVGQIQNDAWQVTVSYVLTGERASYRGVSPRREFDPKNKTFGAFEIAGRYHQLKIDGDAFPIFANPQDSSRKAEAWALGLNWYFNRNVRFALNYERTDFTGGAARGDRPAEKAVLSRFQIAF